jgi:hypothetical protein
MSSIAVTSEFKLSLGITLGQTLLLKTIMAGVNGLVPITRRLAWTVRLLTALAFQEHTLLRLPVCTKMLIPVPIISSYGSTP